MGFAHLTQAAIITVDFETNPVLAAQPGDFFTAGATQTYNSPGNYTVSGGVVLGNPAFLASFTANGSAPNLYMTADFADPSLLATITFDLPPTTFVTTVTGVLFNGQEILENYVVSAFSGITLVSTNNLNNVPIASSISSFANFSLTSTLALPITRVTITTPNAGVNGWDFGVDTVRINQNPVPEPGVAGLLAIGAGLLGFRRRRQRQPEAQLSVPQRNTSSFRLGAALLSATVLLHFAANPLALAGPPWVQQGPGPTINGQDEGITTPLGNNPVSGCIQAVAPHPTDPTILYVAGVNGGVWKTTNATAATPTWTPLTDQALPGLSIRSLASVR